MTLREALARVPAWLWALGAGTLAALAQPPFGFLPGLLAYGGLMLLGEGAPTLRAAFWRGWLAGLAYFLIGCWWVAQAFYVDAATFGWMAPIAAGALAGGLALFWGVAILLYRALKPAGAARVVVFAGAFSLLEYARGHLFTGFPWNLPGETWRAGGALSQAASVVGAYGLTFVTLMVVATPALLARDWRDRKSQVAMACGVALLGALALFGGLRPAPTGTAGSLRIVQPNQPQLPQYDDATYLRLLGDYADLTAQPDARPGPRLVVWPEGAVSWSNLYLAPQSPGRALIMRALRPGDTLLLGAVRAEAMTADAPAFNTLYAVRRLRDDIEIIGLYDKHRLVPFGEYLPFKPVLHAIGFQSLVPVADGFQSGPAPAPLKLGDRIIQPLICYEGLFPGFTGQGGRVSGQRASLIVNISDDAWFGPTSGPRQHLNQAAYRAIEEGLPMVRSTPTGVSAVIDAKGRIQHNLGMGMRGVLDGDIPAGGSPTPYNRWGDSFFGGMLAVSSLIAARRRRVPSKVA